MNNVNFKSVANRDDIPVNPKQTLLATEGSLEDFVAYVSDKVENDEMEMYFLDRDDIVFAYFEEEETVYLYIKAQDEPEKTELETGTKTKLPELKRSGLFTNTIIALMLFLSTLLPHFATAAGYFGGNMVESPTVYSGLANAKFSTPAGTKTIPGYLSVVQSEDYKETAFSFINPNRIKTLSSVSLESLPQGVNEDLITAIVAFRSKFTLDQISSNHGISVTQRQLDEATQLALWIQASKVQMNYQIDPNSISDSAVRALATEITTWATQQLSGLTDEGQMGNYLFPMHQPTLNTEQAKVTKSGNNIEYGPYTIDGQAGASFAYGVLGGTLVDTSKKKLKRVRVDQPFYVQFPQTYNGDKAIRLVGEQMEYSLNYGADRLWLDRNPKEMEVQFSVGGTTGNNGMIQVNAKDSVTGEPVPNVTAKISSTSPLTSIQTDEKGTASYTAPTSTYKVEFTTPDGYIEPKAQEVTIGFAGDIQVINLNLSWSKAVVNFYAVDSESLAPAGDSEAFIYNSEGKAVKRVALKDGKVQGVTLPEGDYTFVQYKTSGNFAINTGTDFTVKAGEVTDVSVSQDPNVHPTVITINGASTNDSWVYTVSTDNKVLFKMNASNSLTLPLPSGTYTVMAQKSDGTASSPSLTFSTVLNGTTEVTLEQEVGTETITFTFLDTKKEQPIPNLVIGLFDEDHNLITYETATEQGVVTFKNVKKYGVYYVNVLAAPDTVSGYSADGNRFLGYTRDYTLHLYSLAEIQEVTKVDTIYRVPNVTYTGVGYTYP